VLAFSSVYIHLFTSLLKKIGRITVSDTIPGIKLIYQTGGANEADDPGYPYKLYVNFSPPEFMSFAFTMLYGGSEEIVVRGITREAIDQFISANNFKRHPRLRRIEITGPEGKEIFQGRMGERE
jgi:hypothetical protein